uniref:Uncharacterized protein n=1 Tax=Pyxicephalus adspersus TaxID=30357 RepID=A0AAV2ZWJ0_PYXAD|nr:TPA: hypothetical protein GDO54_002532 [Pyxicephalus adspersus]
MELSTVLLLSFVILALVWRKFSRPKGFPPGPPALPILGNILQMDFANPLQEFSKQYGPVFSIYLGFTPAVVIQGFKDLKEVLVNKGEVEHALITIHEESVYLIKELRKNQDTLVDPHFILDNAVSNIICSIVFGGRYDYDDTRFRDIPNVVHENMKMDTGFWSQLFNAFGFIKHLPLPHQKVIRNIKVIFGFLRNVLEEHKRTRVPNQPRDYIDCYLDEVDKEKQDGYKSSFDDENLLTCMLDLFIAGRETTSSSLEWTLLYMMIYSDVQEKCRTEMDTVRGDRDHLDYEDRVRMPYTQAVLREVQRFASILPLGVAHSPIKDVQLNGYTIPKGTFIITDLSSVHYDESSWKYPYEFNPDHFLNKDGELIKTESFLPLSAGPRVCLGENMAQIEIFLFFTTMLTHFEFHCADPKSPPDLTPVFGVSQTPRCFKMRLVHRT